ncbi:MAG: EamA family transporter, partial [Pygmaiobacter sp.]
MRKIGEKAFKKNRVVGSVLCGAAALAFSLGGICVKSSVGISPMALNSGRCMIAAALTGGVCKLKNHRLHGTISVWIGAFALCLTGIFYIFSARLSSAANAIILQYTSPAFIALALCRNKESRPSFQKLCWVALVLVGTVVCCGTAGGESAVGNLFGILSGAAFAGVFLAGSMEGADALSTCFFGELLAAVSGLPFLLREQPAGAALGAMLLMG